MSDHYHDLIRRDHDWHSIHAGESGHSEDWEEGFRAGLKQAEELVKRAERSEGIEWGCGDFGPRTARAEEGGDQA
jgi:hypothetical protein